MHLLISQMPEAAQFDDHSLLVLLFASCQHCALAVAAGLPAILKKPLIFPCDGLDFLPNVFCPLLAGMSAIGRHRLLHC